MVGGAVGVLGRVDVLLDGHSARLPAQQQLVLAMLVAAGDAAVSRADLVDALWPEPPAKDRVSPLMSRLRTVLAPCGLTVSAARGQRAYRLRPSTTDVALADVVDVLRFEALAAAAAREPDPGAALRTFEAAEALWAGEPFPGLDEERSLPRVCRDAAARWTGVRARMTREWASIALRHGDLRAGGDPVPSGTAPDDASWLLGFLSVLRSGRADAAERYLEDRHEAHGHDHLTGRAFALMTLRQAGVDVDAAPAGAEPGKPAPGGPLDPDQVRAFVRALTERRGPTLTIGGGSDTARRDALLQVAATAAAQGIRVLRASGSWAGLVGPLWAAALRDLTGPADRWIGGAARLLTLLMGERPVPAATAADHVGRLLRHAAAVGPLVVLAEGTPRVEAPLGAVGVAQDAAAGGHPAGGPLAAVLTVAAAGRTALPPGVVDWLAAAVVVAEGGSADPRFVAAVLGLGIGEARDTEREALASGLVAAAAPVRLRQDGGTERLLAEIRSDVDRMRRLHARCVDLLAAETAGTTVDRLPRLAAHALGARGLLPDDRIAGACLLALDELRRAGRPGRAVALATRALELDLDVPSRVELWLRLGDAHRDVGDLPEAERSYRSARSAARGDPVLQGEAVVRLARRWSEPGQLDVELVALLEQSLDELGDEPLALRLRLGAHLAHKLTMAVSAHEDPDGRHSRRGVALAEAALAELDGVVDEDAVCEVLTECRWALFDAEPPSRLQELSARLDRVSAVSGQERYRTEALFALVTDDLRLGRVNAARLAVEKHRLHAVRSGGSLPVWLQQTADTVLDLWEGRFDAAERRLFVESRGLLDRLEASGDPHADNLQQTWTGQVYWLFRERGRLGELVERGFATPIERHGYFPVWQAGLALLLAEIGQPEQAADQILAMATESHDMDRFPTHGWAIPTLAVLAEAWERISRSRPGARRPELVALAGRWEKGLAPYAGELAMAGWPTVLAGPVARALGLLRLVAGDGPGALAWFASAAEVVGAARPPLARLRFDTARAHRLAGGSAQAVGALLDGAEAAAVELGMVLLAHDIADYRRAD
jgi:tetratricopeptide (TPR) repeat protein